MVGSQESVFLSSREGRRDARFARIGAVGLEHELHDHKCARTMMCVSNSFTRVEGVQAYGEWRD